MPITGRTRRKPTTDTASHPAVTMISLCSHVPSTVSAPIIGTPSMSSTRITGDVPEVRRLGVLTAGISEPLEGPRGA